MLTWTASEMLAVASQTALTGACLAEHMLGVVAWCMDSHGPAAVAGLQLPAAVYMHQVVQMMVQDAVSASAAGAAEARAGA